MLMAAITNQKMNTEDWNFPSSFRVLMGYTLPERCNKNRAKHFPLGILVSYFADTYIPRCLFCESGRLYGVETWELRGDGK